MVNGLSGREREKRGKLVKNVSKRIFITRRVRNFISWPDKALARGEKPSGLFMARSASNYARKPEIIHH
jgi:hypothetical protein